MAKSLSRFQKLLISVAVLSAAALLGAILLYRYIFTDELQADFERFSSEAFDSAFLSMYPIDTYKEEDFEYWRGKNTIIATREIPNQYILWFYLWKIQRTGQYVDTIYLGIRPEDIDSDALTRILQKYPQYHFQVMLAHPSLEYWTGLSEHECNRALDAYQDYSDAWADQFNVSFYMYGASEWLIANPSNYESGNDYLTNEEISLTIMLHCDEEHGYWLNSDTSFQKMTAFENLIYEARNNPTEYSNLEGADIVFFGDSVIGNYTDTTSIPNVTGALTGADCFNLGYGGTPATQNEPGSPCLPTIVDAFLCKDPSLLPADSQAREGLNHFVASNSDKVSCFVINYGLNDYFNGQTISAEDPYDTYTFTGAFRYSVNALRNAYPDARIIIITPNFVTLFENGTEPRGDNGHMLTDYADALIALSEELDVELLDNHNELDINAGNYWKLLVDGCHPNQDGRFVMGQRIALLLSE